MNNALDDARRLMRRAQADLNALRNMGDREKFDENIYGFHAQQAVEKSLKAWLAFLGRSYPFRHDLGELLAALAAAGEDVEDLWTLADLTPFAVQLRYETVEADTFLNREHVAAEIAALILRIEQAMK